VNSLVLRELLEGNPARLRYVYRYSTSRVQQQETVAEHSYYVALYALFVGRWVNEQMDLGKLAKPTWWGPATDRVLVENLLQRALLHDLEESRSGDFPRPFKHSSPELKEMLERASRISMDQVIRPIFGIPLNQDDEIDNGIADEFLMSWLDAKDATPEGRILEFCDFLSVLSFMMQERGNHQIKRHVTDMQLYFERFGEKEYDFVRPLVDQAEVLLGEVFS